MTLVEFLEARIGEDERAARQVMTTATAPATAVDQWSVRRDDNDYVIESTLGPGWRKHEVIRYVGWTYALGDHIARWDPARVLAECASRRAIIGIHERSGHRVGGYTLPLNTLVFRCRACHDTDWPCPTLVALAAPYSSHPDCPDLGGVG